MYKLITSCLVAICIGMTAGCAYFKPEDIPPPLPPIKVPKQFPKLSKQQFNLYPWEELGKADKDADDKYTTEYVIKANDTLESIALKQMGDPKHARWLATYNSITPGEEKAGDTIVIPDPIIGMSLQQKVKHKGKKRFGDPLPMSTDLTKGDEYKFVLESNVAGYCYVFREQMGRVANKVVVLYPRPPKKSRSRKSVKPISDKAAKVEPHKSFEIPPGRRGFKFSSKKVGDTLHVFLSLRTIPDLQDLLEKKKITKSDLELVIHRTREGDIFTDKPYRLLRIKDKLDEILYFSVVLNG